jgi:ribosomal protein S18 acetylase RimI-like enzyme
MQIDYAVEPDLSVAEFVDVMERSGLAERRPLSDPARVARMLKNSSLILVAREQPGGRIVGVSRSVSDFAYCCYVSDLAVDRDCQGRGIGKRLLNQTRASAGPECTCLLLAAPDAVGFYVAIGMPKADNAFIYPREW